MLHAVIMAGGSGTRFWPKSRRNQPKQLIRLFGDATMLQQTVARIAPLAPAERTWIITGEDQADAVRAQLPELPPDHVVAEPCPRDTAPCVGLAATLLLKHDPDATMIVMPADHVITPEETFVRTVRAAVATIDTDPSALITFGIKPTRAETGYGYIERGDELEHGGGVRVHRAKMFREKPNKETAEQFVADGGFVWNSGIFVWKARTILDEIAEHCADLAEALARIGQALQTPRERAVLEAEFPKMKKRPIDKAVMEKARNVLVFEVNYDWNDVGDWRALASLLPRDELTHNAIQGNVRTLDTKNSIAIADQGGLIAMLGLEDIVVIQSKGATLVARKDALDKLKELVEGLEPEYL